mmetsp:Transcript_110741/g.357458  ORF Transcript_110741/g.357458 Transcript_110741/m.357458 type:complete len:270 (+) Transcript_110741:366-1175(+)
MAVVAQVRPDLVQAARVQPDLDEAHHVPIGRAQVLHRADLRARRLPPRPYAAPGKAGRRFHLEQRPLQEPRPHRHSTPAEADVLLPDPPRAELQPRIKEAAVATGPQESARRVSVQSVHKAVGPAGVPCNCAAKTRLPLQPVLQWPAAAWSVKHVLWSVFCPVIVHNRHGPPRWLPKDAQPGLRPQDIGLNMALATRCLHGRRLGQTSWCLSTRWGSQAPAVQDLGVPLQSDGGRLDHGVLQEADLLERTDHREDNTVWPRKVVLATPV